MSCIAKGGCSASISPKSLPRSRSSGSQDRCRDERPGGEAGQGVQGTFPWHRHDEVFLVWRGRFRVEFRDRIVGLRPGEFVVVPQGVEHRTAADEEAEVILWEPAGVLNTGNVNDKKFT